MFSVTSKVTSLVTLLTGALCFGMALWLASNPAAYEAVMYLAFVGLAFLTIGIAISVIDLAWGDEIERQREAQREAYRRGWR